MPDNVAHEGEITLRTLDVKIDALTTKVDGLTREMRQQTAELHEKCNTNRNDITASAVMLAGHLEAHKPWTRAVVGAIIAAIAGAASAVYAAIVRSGHG